MADCFFCLLVLRLLLISPLHEIWIGSLTTYSAFHITQIDPLFGQGEAEASQESQGMEGEMHFIVIFGR